MSDPVDWWQKFVFCQCMFVMVIYQRRWTNHFLINCPLNLALKKWIICKTEQTCQEIKYLDNFNKIAIKLSFKRCVQFVVNCLKILVTEESWPYLFLKLLGFFMCILWIINDYLLLSSILDLNFNCTFVLYGAVLYDFNLE